jgi:hypothetical protein
MKGRTQGMLYVRLIYAWSTEMLSTEGPKADDREESIA